MATNDDQAPRHELRGSLIGGCIAALALFGMAVAVGRIETFEALSLIQSVLPTARFLATAVITAATTVLALMLTLIGLSLRSEFSFHPRLYQRARYITNLSVLSLTMGVGLLLAVSVPISEVEELRSYYTILYYILVAVIALVGGMIVSVGLLIGATLRDLTDIGHPDGDSDLLAGESYPDIR
jgi:hypothetical protein